MPYKGSKSRLHTTLSKSGLTVAQREDNRRDTRQSASKSTTTHKPDKVSNAKITTTSTGTMIKDEADSKIKEENDQKMKEETKQKVVIKKEPADI